MKYTYIRVKRSTGRYYAGICILASTVIILCIQWYIIVKYGTVPYYAGICILACTVIILYIQWYRAIIFRL